MHAFKHVRINILFDLRLLDPNTREKCIDRKKRELSFFGRRDIYIHEDYTYSIKFYLTEEKRIIHYSKKVQVGNDQEKAQSEKDSYSKNRGGKK